MRCRPSRSTATVLEKVLDTATAAISARRTFPRPMSFFAAFMKARHHSSGSCSAPPPGRKVMRGGLALEIDHLSP